MDNDGTKDERLSKRAKPYKPRKESAAGEDRKQVLSPAAISVLPERPSPIRSMQRQCDGQVSLVFAGRRMECAGKGSRTPCSGQATRRCGRCRAVAYCSISHQVSHWSVHKKECERLDQQMNRADVLNDFPFTFTEEATVKPLTIYWGIQLAIMRSLIYEITSEIHIHYIGPEKELYQLAVFGELCALFPGVRMHIYFVGNAVPQDRDGEVIALYRYCHCIETDCECKSLDINVDSCSSMDKSCPVMLHLCAGYYHDRYRDLSKDSSPNIIIAPNAGIAAYRSWLPTIELIKEMKVPALFSDYCEEAAHLATHCISSISGSPPSIPIQLNPFRQPLAVEDSALFLPCYSNCFLFGM